MAKFDQFQHWAQSVKAGKSQSVKIMLTGLICFVALGVLLVLMMNYSSHSNNSNNSNNSGYGASGSGQKLAQESEVSMNHMSQVFEENENKIKELQNITQSLVRASALSSDGTGPSLSHAERNEASANKDKAIWDLRARAPSEIYSQDSGNSLGNSLGNDLGVSGKLGAAAKLLNAESGLLKQYQSLEVFNSAESEKPSGHVILHPNETVAQGEFIHAVIETAINSDLPGMVRAEITTPVYSYQGENILIPAGSRLVGQYASKLENGASAARLFIMWNRIITPSGLSILINSPGVDALGRSGMSADDIDHHFFQIFGQAVLFSILGAGVSSVGVSDNAEPNSADQFRQSMASALQDSASESLKSNTKNISPTLHIYQGDLVVVFVSKDLDLFESLGGSRESANF